MLQTIAPKAFAKGVEVALRCDPSLPVHCIGDPTRILQIVTNLVSNAVKYTPAGGTLHIDWGTTRASIPFTVG